MNKLFVYITLFFVFVSVFSTARFAIAQQNPFENIDANEIANYESKLVVEAKKTITKDDVVEFNNSVGKKIQLVKNKQLSWKTNFKKNIDNLANKDDKYIRLKEIINELYSMFLINTIEIDLDRTIVLCDEGISIKDLSFFHYCKGFAYMYSNSLNGINPNADFEFSVREFNKVDKKLKVLISDAYRYIARAKLFTGDIDGGLKELSEGSQEQPSFHVFADKMWVNYKLGNENTKEYINDKKIFLILLLLNEDFHNGTNYVETLSNSK